jgi:hypothetical protein
MWQSDLDVSEKCFLCNDFRKGKLWQTVQQIKGKGHAHNRPQGPNGVPGRLRPRIFLTFRTMRVVGRQPHALAAFTLRGNPWYSFLEAESTPGHMVPSVATEKVPSVTPPGIDPETVRLVAQCLNHYANPDPRINKREMQNCASEHRMCRVEVNSTRS